MNKRGFSLFSFLIYIACISVSLSLLTPFIYQGYTSLLSVLQELQEENRVQNVFQKLSQDIQSINNDVTISRFFNELYIQHNNKTIEWSIANEQLSRKKGKQKRVVLQNVVSIEGKKKNNSIHMCIITKKNVYYHDCYVYKGITI